MDVTDDPRFTRLAAGAALAVAVLSIIYAVAFLLITPSAQRGDDAAKALQSYLDDPTGLRLASIALLLSGVAATVVAVGLYGRLRRHGPLLALWAGALGVVAGAATAAHGFADLVGLDKLAHRFADGDAATRAAVLVANALPSPTDPRGLATFGLAGLVALAFG